MTKDEALKLALKALETSMYPQQKQLQAITAIKEALANEALEKMAENARELGLDYETEQEPMAWATREDFYFELNRRVDRMREEMMIKTITMRCKEYDLALPIVDMYCGHIVVGQVSFPHIQEGISLLFMCFSITC